MQISGNRIGTMTDVRVIGQRVDCELSQRFGVMNELEEMTPAFLIIFSALF
jgi:hypothetical protein